nr:MAG: hypothetical protein [Porcellio scaber clopovirus]
MGVIRGHDLIHKIVKIFDKESEKRNRLESNKRKPHFNRLSPNDVLTQKFFDITEDTDLENLMSGVYKNETCILVDTTALLFEAKTSLKDLTNHFIKSEHLVDEDNKTAAAKNRDKKEISNKNKDECREDLQENPHWGFLPNRLDLEDYIFRKFLDFDEEEEYKFLAYDYVKDTNTTLEKEHRHFLISFYFYFFQQFTDHLKDSLKFVSNSRYNIKFLIFFIDKGYIALKQQEREKRKLKRLEMNYNKSLSDLLYAILKSSQGKNKNEAKIPDELFGRVLKLVCDKIPFWSLVKFLQEPFIILNLLKSLNLESIYIAEFDSNEADVDMSRFCQYAKFGVKLRNIDSNSSSLSSLSSSPSSSKSTPPPLLLPPSLSIDDAIAKRTLAPAAVTSNPRRRQHLSIQDSSLFDMYVGEKNKELSSKKIKMYFSSKNSGNREYDDDNNFAIKEYDWHKVIERICELNIKNILLFGTDVDMAFFPLIIDSFEKAIVSEILQRRKNINRITRSKIKDNEVDEPNLLVLQRRQKTSTDNFNSTSKIYYNARFKKYEFFSTDYCFYNLSKLIPSGLSGMTAIIWSLLCGSDYSKPIFKDLAYSRKNNLIKKILNLDQNFCLCPIETFVRILERQQNPLTKSYLLCESCGKHCSKDLETTVKICLFEFFEDINEESFLYEDWFNAMKKFSRFGEQFPRQCNKDFGGNDEEDIDVNGGDNGGSGDDFSFTSYNIAALASAVMIYLDIDQLIKLNHSDDYDWQSYAEKRITKNLKKNSNKGKRTRTRNNSMKNQSLLQPPEKKFMSNHGRNNSDDDEKGGGGNFSFFSSSSSSSSSSFSPSPSSGDDASGSEGNEIFSLKQYPQTRVNRTIKGARNESLIYGGGDQNSNNQMLLRNTKEISENLKPQHVWLQLIRSIVEYIAGTSVQHEKMKNCVPRAHIFFLETKVVFFHTAQFIRSLTNKRSVQYKEDMKKE